MSNWISLLLVVTLMYASIRRKLYLLSVRLYCTGISKDSAILLPAGIPVKFLSIDHHPLL